MLALHSRGTPDFEDAVRRLRERGADDFQSVEPAVRQIVADVRRDGDSAVLRHIEAHEGRRPSRLVRSSFDGEAALGRLEAPVRAALEEAARRIRAYHERQVQVGFSYTEGGVSLSLRVRGLRRVGVYAPGGKARYPSSVLMTAIPAQVAGVREIVLATPLSGDASSSNDGSSTQGDDLVLAAAHLAGVTTILDAGGAQAIAALAYGTESLARVDKVVGPGNVYVTCAKRLVYGDVDLDGIAGPSEVLVLADASADPSAVAADLLSQAEHDELAVAVLITTSSELATSVQHALQAQMAAMERREVARASIERCGMALVVETPDQMIHIANEIGGEHVALHLEDAEATASALESAGAIFVGRWTPVAAGDYLAGPSHVLPTGGACRFGSALGVYDFVSRRSVIEYTQQALANQAEHICTLAAAEGLPAHATSVRVRLDDSSSTSATSPLAKGSQPLNADC